MDWKSQSYEIRLKNSLNCMQPECQQTFTNFSSFVILKYFFAIFLSKTCWDVLYSVWKLVKKVSEYLMMIFKHCVHIHTFIFLLVFPSFFAGILYQVRPVGNCDTESDDQISTHILWITRDLEEISKSINSLR